MALDDLVIASRLHRKSTVGADAFRVKGCSLQAFSGLGLSGFGAFRGLGVPKGIHTSSLRHQGDPTIQLPAVPRGIFDRVDCVGRCSHVLKRRIQSFRKLRPHGFGRSSGASDSRVDGFRA